jgi:hypothetical protein
MKPLSIEGDRMMNRTKCAVVFAALAAVGLLSAKVAICADGPAKGPAAWDDGNSSAMAGHFEVAQRGPDDLGPPGPPPDRSELPPGPLPTDNRHGMGPGMGGFGPGPGMPGMGGPDGLFEPDPTMFKLHREEMNLAQQAHELAEQYRRATVDERPKIKQQIEDVVNKQFDIRGQMLQLRLKQLENQLQKLRESVDKRAKARKELVEKRVADVIGKEEEARF